MERFLKGEWGKGKGKGEKGKRGRGKWEGPSAKKLLNISKTLVVCPTS